MARIYFAYGSNLHRAQMQERCPGSRPLRPWILQGWRLLFRGWADVVPDPTAAVVGALYAVTLEDERALDAYEAVPDEYFQQVIADSPGSEEIFLYRMHPAPLAPPAPWYLELIRQGYRDWQLDPAALEAALDPVPGHSRPSRGGALPLSRAGGSHG